MQEITSTDQKKMPMQGTFYSFQCCLTGVLMQEPVMDNDGNNYERKVVDGTVTLSADVKWAIQKLNQEFRPNQEICNAIERFAAARWSPSSVSGLRSFFSNFPVWNFQTVEESMKKMRFYLAQNIESEILESLFLTKPMKVIRSWGSNHVYWASLKAEALFSSVGQDGKNGPGGKRGSNGMFTESAGANGSSGSRGCDGSDSKNLTISIVAVPDQNVFLVTPDDAQSTVMPLFRGDVNVKLFSRGGDGGNGGQGGDGGDGAVGRDGKDASRYIEGTDGTSGGKGGNGGDGGYGGNGGKCGDITIFINEMDIDILPVKEHEFQQGKGGIGGQPGRGGQGGKGGKGGSSYSYEVTKTYKDDEGNTQTYEEMRFTKGGSYGPDGRSGMNGSAGQNGRNGSIGKYEIRVIRRDGALRAYNSIFHLSVQGIKPLTSTTGVFEPGQKVVLSAFRLRNHGDMPSPESNMYITLESNEHLDLSSIGWCRVPKSVLGQSSIEFQDNFSTICFTIKRVPVPREGTILSVSTRLMPTTYLWRINQCISHPQNLPYHLVIQYPVSITPIQGLHQVLPGFSAPLAFKLKNDSLVALGSAAPSPRLLKLRIRLFASCIDELVPVLTLKGIDGSEPVDHGLASPLILDIGSLEANTQKPITGFLRFTGAYKSNHERVRLEVTLLLADVNEPTNEENMVIVQIQSHHVQLAKLFSPSVSGAPLLLLVLNSSVDRGEVQRWSAIAQKLSMDFEPWNLSLYQNFKFRELTSVLAIKIVVFLNTSFIVDDSSALGFGKSVFPSDYLHPIEIFDAARHLGIRTYLVHGPDYSSGRSTASSILPDLRPLIVYPLCESQAMGNEPKTFENKKSALEHFAVPMKAERDELLKNESQFVQIKARRLFVPSQKKMVGKMKKLNHGIAKLLPCCQYFYRIHFSPKCLGTTFFIRKFQYGEIEIRRGLDKSYATVAASTMGNSENMDLFAVAKLIPFDKKLDFFETDPQNPLRLKSILSDLVDEISNLDNHAKLFGSMSEDRLKLHFSALDELKSRNFDMIKGQPGGLEALKELLVTYRFAVTKSGTQICCFRSYTAVKAFVSKTCAEIMTHHFPSIDKREFRRLRRAFSKSAGPVHSLNHFLDPFSISSKVLFNQWQSVSEAESNISETFLHPPIQHLADWRGRTISDCSDPLAEAYRFLHLCVFHRREVAKPIDPRQARLSTKVQELYHQTDPETWEKIKASRLMKRGESGLAGGGIYFAENPEATRSKARRLGVIITARVKLGHCKTLTENGDANVTFKTLLNAGFDSVMIPRQAGREWVVYNWDQVDILWDKVKVIGK